ncbi:MAG: xanthine dehydrogenase family protein molybdopterin-binding subunit [Bacillota bacterium]|jgi:CO/xanthine dehydrogenase Mo-binding subunit
MDFLHIGKSIKRCDGRSKITGQTKFLADMVFPGMLYAKVLRSEHAHALIKHLDTSKALAMPGVKAVVTGDDCVKRTGFVVNDQYPLAKGKTRFMGEPVAAVVADSEEAAVLALDQIVVEYEPLKACTDPEVSAQMELDAPLIHEDKENYALRSDMRPAVGTNIIHHYKLRKGNVEKAFQEAYLIVENKYTFPLNAHVALEPHGAIAQFLPEDGINIWSTTQGPFVVQQSIADMLDLPLHKVRVFAPPLGGGFGGKSEVTVEPLIAIIARAVPGRYVRLVLEREEVFTGTVLGRGMVGHYQTAVNKEGLIIGEKNTIYWNVGAYSDYCIHYVTCCGYNSVGPYDIENIHVDSYGVYTNNPPLGAYRGYGHPEVHWACERQRDIIARKLGMSPVEFRLKNCLGAGKANSIGQIMREDNGNLELCIKKTAQELGLGKDEPQKPEGSNAAPWYLKRGKGIAAFYKSPSMPSFAQSSAVLKMHGDGTVSVSIGAVEMGQGLYITMAQIAAEALGIAVDRIGVIPYVDTEVSPYEWQTVASHSTWAVGNAIVAAAQDFLKKANQAAAEVLKVKTSELGYQDGRIFIKDQPQNGIPLCQLALGYVNADGSAGSNPIIGTGSFVPEGITNLDPETGMGNNAADWTFGCQGVEVEINLLTGDLEVKKMVTAIDAGRIINPMSAKGQIIGGMVQAMGSALSEKIIFGKDGKMRNAGLTDYKVPTSLDIPEEMKVIFVETPLENGPYGARGLGEHPCCSVPPAIGNAIYDALGIDFFTLPMDAAAILKKLKESGRKDGKGEVGTNA